MSDAQRGFDRTSALAQSKNIMDDESIDREERKREVWLCRNYIRMEVANIVPV
jgi:hypothetical protein